MAWRRSLPAQPLPSGVGSTPTSRARCFSLFLDVLAARLLSLMLLIFSALTLAPGMVAAPHDQGTWASNADNLAAVAAAWILADWLAQRRKAVRTTVVPA